jgi:hypothetical protein
MLVPVSCARRERVDPDGDSQENDDSADTEVFTILGRGFAVLAPIVAGDLHLPSSVARHLERCNFVVAGPCYARDR